MAQSKIISFFRPAQAPPRDACPKPSSQPATSSTVEEAALQQDKRIEKAKGQAVSPAVDISTSKNINDTTIDNVPASLCEFEKERLARIQRNMAIMKDLGLGNASNVLANKADQGERPVRYNKRKKKTPISMQVDHQLMPRRRSLRHAKEGVVIPEAVTEQHNEKENVPKVFQENKNLLRYVCDVDYKVSIDTDDDVDNARFFRERRPALFDTKLTRCYSLDFWPKGDLVVGGGKNGHASVFSCQYNKSETGHDIDPLISQKLHKGWICDVRFVDAGYCPKLLTAGNDGVMALWDLSLQEETTKDMKQQYFTDSVHDGGIFSMDYQPVGIRIVTGSKDGSVAITEVEQFKTISSLKDLHDGHVVKCVSWRKTLDNNDVHCFLSAGNDGKTKLHDQRAGQSSSKTCHTASSVVNTLVWNPFDANMFMSAGNNHLHVHDVRVEGQVVISLSGHNDTGSSGIYQPIFVNTGKSILTAGSSKASRYLTLFDLQGKIISQGDVGYSVGASLWCPQRNLALFSGPRKIALFEPRA